MADVDLLILALGIKPAQLKRIILTGVNVESSKPSLLSKITEVAPQAGLTLVVGPEDSKAPQIERHNIKSAELPTKTDDGVYCSVFEAQQAVAFYMREALNQKTDIALVAANET